MHKIVYLTVKKGNILVNILLLKIFIANYCHLYLLNKIFVGRVIVTTAPELCQKPDFFLKNRMKEIFAYVLEFMLTLARMQNNSIFM